MSYTNIKYQILIIKFQIPNIKCDVPDVKFRVRISSANNQFSTKNVMNQISSAKEHCQTSPNNKCHMIAKLNTLHYIIAILQIKASKLH